MAEDMSKENERDLAGYYGYTIPMNEFFRCGLSVDCVIFGYDKKEISVLLIKRGVEPFKGEWALPGDLMYPYEGLNEAATRVLKSLTGINSLYMEQLKTFGEVNRHPIGRIITVSYYALVNMEDYNPKASSWAELLEWHPIGTIPDLAFDHNEILESSIHSLRKDFITDSLGFKLLPKKFTLNDVQYLHEAIMDEKYDKANFRKKILASKRLVPLEETENNVSHRPAKLYAFEEAN
ncbi:MAG: 8-oxo-dGTP diphosphatase [Patiriisocius sp.]|jgi:8-oxo-dGTP diphosphatase